MILTLFILFFAVALVALGVGFWMDEPLFHFVGFLIIFLLSTTLLFDSVEYQSGTVTNSTLTYSNGTLTNQVDVLTYSYTPITNTYRSLAWWVAFLFSLLTGFGMGYMLMNMRRDKETEDNYERDFGGDRT